MMSANRLISMNVQFTIFTCQVFEILLVLLLVLFVPSIWDVTCTCTFCACTLNCFALSSGIRWGGSHSQYFPIQPFTNSVTSCHNPLSQLSFTIVFHNRVSQSCFTIVFHNSFSQSCFTIVSSQFQSDCEVPYCTPCTMYSPQWCTVARLKMYKISFFCCTF